MSKQNILLQAPYKWKEISSTKWILNTVSRVVIELDDIDDIRLCLL